MKTCLILLGLVFGVCEVVWSAEVWSQWRGEQRDGSITGSYAWPEQLREGDLTEVWSAELGLGYPGPIVSADKVFTVETRDASHEVVRAFDREKGTELWQVEWEGAMKVPFFARKNGSWVRSTPAYRDGKLYVGGIRDVLVCIDTEAGKVIWKKDFVGKDSPLPSFGCVSSPLLHGDGLYLQIGSAVRRIDPATGETVWEALKDSRSMYGSAFSSPVVATLLGKEQIVAQTRSHLAGVDIESGEVLWKYEVKAFRGMNILTPTVIGDRVFTATYGGGSYMFSLENVGGKPDVAKDWQVKTEGYMSSPVVRGKHVYMHGRDKRLHCIGLEDGKVAWSSKEKFGMYWSKVFNGDRVLALDDEGMLRYFVASPEGFKDAGNAVVDKRENTWAHLAVCGDEIFVRDLKGVRVFRWEGVK